MKQNLQLRISQNLALTPQLQQSIRLLQLSTLELNQELETILQDNPLLELVEGDDDFGASENTAPAAESPTTEAGTAEQEADTNSFDQASTTEVANPIEQTAEHTDDDSPTTSDEFTSPDFEDEFDEYGSTSNWTKVADKIIQTKMTMTLHVKTPSALACVSIYSAN